MANVRTIAREIAPRVGLTPRETEKVIHNYLLVLSAAAKTSVNLGCIGTLDYWEFIHESCDLDPLRYRASEGLLRAVKEQTLPPKVAKRLGR